MRTAILARLAQAIPTLLGVTILVFLFLSLTGDPVRQMLGPEATPEEIRLLRTELRLDRPLPERYVHWLGGVLRGDFGRSYTTKRPVAATISQRLPATVELAVIVMFVATTLAVIVAVLSARRPGGLFDSCARSVIFVFLAMPSFWLGIEFIILFSRHLGWFPPAGRSDVPLTAPGGLRAHFAHLVLPALTLGIGTAAALTRVLRAALLEVLGSDYVRTARAKGLGERAVLLRHALRNALIPFITLSGLTVAALLEGSIITETVFQYPGIGLLMVDAIKQRDAPMAMAGVLLAAVLYVTINLFVDMLYVAADPRVRVGGRASA